MHCFKREARNEGNHGDSSSRLLEGRICLVGIEALLSAVKHVGLL